jgi:hypothetical protein
MTKDNSAISPPANRHIDTATALKFLAAAFITGGGLLLHLIGAVTHRTYMDSFGLDIGVFPKAIDTVLINGYYSTLSSMTATLGIWFTTPNILAVIVAVAAYVWCLTLIQPRKPPNWLQTKLGKLLKFVIVGILVYLAVPVGIIVASVVMIAPVAIGEHAGRSAAETDMKRFKKGCDEPAQSRVRCVELRKDGATTAQGFIIDWSATHIALWDVTLKRARTIERASLELVGPTPYEK